MNLFESEDEKAKIMGRKSYYRGEYSGYSKFKFQTKDILIQKNNSSNPSKYTVYISPSFFSEYQNCSIISSDKVKENIEKYIVDQEYMDNFIN